MNLVINCDRLANHPWFKSLIMGLIVLSAIVLGVETSASVMERWGWWLVRFNWIIKIVFVAEITIRMMAYGRRVGSFFRDGWNVFDFAIVAASMLPINGEFAMVGRLLRLLRVTRLVSVSPQLRLIVTTTLTSIPSMGHVVTLTAMLLYIYGVTGFYLFHRTDPEHWGTLGRAMLTLFKIITLEGWVEMQAAVLPMHPWAWVFFSSFIVIAVFVVVNLFIAVVINNLQTAKEQEQHAADARSDDAALLERLERMKRDIAEIESILRQRR